MLKKNKTDPYLHRLSVLLQNCVHRPISFNNSFNFLKLYLVRNSFFLCSCPISDPQQRVQSEIPISEPVRVLTGYP